MKNCNKLGLENYDESWVILQIQLFTAGLNILGTLGKFNT